MNTKKIIGIVGGITLLYLLSRKSEYDLEQSVSSNESSSESRIKTAYSEWRTCEQYASVDYWSLALPTLPADSVIQEIIPEVLAVDGSQYSGNICCWTVRNPSGGLAIATAIYGSSASFKVRFIVNYL